MWYVKNQDCLPPYFIVLFYFYIGEQIPNLKRVDFLGKKERKC